MPTFEHVFLFAVDWFSIISNNINNYVSLKVVGRATTDQQEKKPTPSLRMTLTIETET